MPAIADKVRSYSFPTAGDLDRTRRANNASGVIRHSLLIRSEGARGSV